MELQLDLTLSTGPGQGSGSIQDRGKNNKRSLDHQSPFFKRNGKVEDEFVVGWPPVKSWRKQLRHHNRTNYVYVENSGGGRGTNSLYVKVKMEGIGIARKIDLSAHRSYTTLAPKLIALFGKCVENAEYKLMYQNKEGKWLHAKDVPWECLIKSVQRLKLEKNGY